MIRAAAVLAALLLSSSATVLANGEPLPKPVKVVKQTDRTPEVAKRITRTLAASRGMSRSEIRCLFEIWTRESNFRPTAKNRTGVRTSDGIRYAGGVPQILGLDPKTPTRRQIERGLAYVEARYGSACAAWRFWQRNRWY